MFTKLGRDEELLAPHMCCCASARSAQRRIHGVAKVGHRGPLLQNTSSGQKATATNGMYSNDLEACGKKQNRSTEGCEEVLLFFVPF